MFATGGFPLAYGDRSQEEAIWEVLAWATDHPLIKGAVVVRGRRLWPIPRAARAERTVPAGDRHRHSRHPTTARIGAMREL